MFRYVRPPEKGVRRRRLAGWYRQLLEIDVPEPIRALINEEVRRSPHAQIAPLVEDDIRNLMRSLEIDPDNWYPMSYLSFLKHAQAYVAGTKEEHLRASSEADESTPKIHRIMEAKARAAGQPWPAAMRQQRTAAIEHFEDFIRARPDSPESVFA